MRVLSRMNKSLLVAFAASVVSVSALAQAWPTKNVTVVVPWPPGGPSDIAARPLSKGLTEALGQSFVIDNRAGGGGNIGTAAVTRAAPDGYTLLITSSAPIVINPSLYKKMTFDPLKDLVPVTNLLRAPLVLVVSPTLPVKNLKELMAHIKATNGKFSYASSGSGTPQHLTTELFSSVTKLNMTHVPYKGSAPAIADVLGGHIPMMFDSTIAIMPHIKSGKVRPIAISGAQRSPLLPDVPTFAEAGVAGIESYAWYGLFAPAKTPKDVVAKINAEAIKVMKGPEFTKIRGETGSDFVGDTPENFNKFVQAEATRWGKVVKDSGATVD